MTPKMSSFIVVLIVIGIVSFGFGSLFAKLNSAYPTTYDNSTFSSFNKLSNLTAQAEDIQDATDINERSGVLDIIGGYFSSAYQALKITTASVETFNTMADAAAANSQIDNAGVYKNALVAIVLIIIFVGIIISTMVKRES